MFIYNDSNERSKHRELKKRTPNHPAVWVVQAEGAKEAEQPMEQPKEEPKEQPLQKAEEVGRESWSSKLEFVLSSVGFAVGLGNLWRFPYMAYTYGGGSFLIPYGVMLVAVGIPVFFLEMSTGQYGRVGSNRIYGGIAKCFGTIGYCMLFLSWIISLYYIIIIAWAVYFFFASFSSVLPWSECGEESSDKCCDTNCTEITDSKSPSEDFFSYQVLGTSHPDLSWSHFGPVQWKIALCLLFCYLVVIASLSYGIKSLGKLSYVSAFVPYTLLLIMFVFVLTLPGAGEGIRYYVTPDFSKIWNFKVWTAAASQIIFTLSIALGGLQTLASYNDFDNNIHRDALIVAISNCLTSMFCGFIVFGTLGFLADKKGVDVDNVVKSGITLAFVAYPEALSKMPASQMWSVFFFIIIFFLGIQTEITLVEGVVSGILDDFPNLKSKRLHILFVISAFGFLLGLPMTAQYGLNLLGTIDSYVNNFCLIQLTFLEVFLMGVVYGSGKMLKNIEQMKVTLSPAMKWYYTVTWTAISPMTLFVLSIGFYSNGVEATESNIPPAIGFSIVVTMLAIFLVNAIYSLIKAEDIRSVFKPLPLWNQNDGWIL